MANIYIYIYTYWYNLFVILSCCYTQCDNLTGDDTEWKNACTCILDDNCDVEFSGCWTEHSMRDCQHQVKEIFSLCDVNNKDEDEDEDEDVDVDVDVEESDFYEYDTCLNNFAYKEPHASYGATSLVRCVDPIYKRCILGNRPSPSRT